jgi:hypothetical protein
VPPFPPPKKPASAAKPPLACFYKTLTLMLYDLINHPNLMGARCSCGQWKVFSTLWRCYNENNPGNETQECNLNKVLANRSKEEEIFPLTTPMIAEAQKADVKLNHC